MEHKPVWWDEANAYQRYQYKKRGAVPTRFKVVKCEACLAPFKPSPHGGRQITCSDECRTALHIHRHKCPKQKEKKADAQRQRLKDPSRRVVHSIRTRHWIALNGQMTDTRCSRYLGIDRDGLVKHLLETDYARENGLTIENYGESWHVDHIKPLAAFDLSDETQVREATNYKNLQALTVEDNLKKGALHDGVRHTFKG